MLSETVRLFPDSLGREDEYEYYVRKFQSAESDCFAIICPDFDCLQQSGAAMELALRHLLRLDLVPALLLSGPRARAMFTELSEREIPVDAVEAALGTDAVRAGVGRSGEAGRIPVIVHEDSSLLPALRHAQPLVARRLHIVRMRGALADSAGEDIAFYRINDSSPAVDPADETVLELAVNLLENRTLHVSITSPLNLLKEIFTIKGAGTVVRYGSRIEEYSGADAVDRERLRALLARSFERGLRNEEFLDRATSLYLESEYQGAILLESHPMGQYLSKFAVDRNARGLGIAQELWEKVAERTPAIFWRSRRGNSINRWYQTLADGSHRVGKWQVFWRGVDPEHLPSVIRFCVEREEDFVAQEPRAK